MKILNHKKYNILRGYKYTQLVHSFEPIVLPALSKGNNYCLTLEWKSSDIIRNYSEKKKSNEIVICKFSDFQRRRNPSTPEMLVIISQI